MHSLVSQTATTVFQSSKSTATKLSVDIMYMSMNIYFITAHLTVRSPLNIYFKLWH